MPEDTIPIFLPPVIVSEDEAWHSVIQFPVAGPQGNNKLVFLRGRISQPNWDALGIEDFDEQLKLFQLDTKYHIVGYDKNNRKYWPTKISATAYVSSLSQPNDNHFSFGVEFVRPLIDPLSGNVMLNVVIREWDIESPEGELLFQFFYSAWILTYQRPDEDEGWPEFTPPPRLTRDQATRVPGPGRQGQTPTRDRSRTVPRHDV